MRNGDKKIINSKGNKTKLVIITFILLISIFSLCFVLAKDIDASKKTIMSVNNSKLSFGYPEITIKNASGMKEELLTAKLESHMNECMINCEDIQIINLYKDSVLIQDVRFIDKNGFEYTFPYNLSYQILEEYEVEVPIYEEICGSIESLKDVSNEAKGILEGRLFTDAKEFCYKEIVKYQKETKTRYIWNDYEMGTEMKAGEYKVKLTTQKDLKLKVDYQLKSQDIWMNETAWWDSYTHYREITGTMTKAVLTSVNSSQGVSIGGETAYVYAIGQSGTNAIYYTDVNSSSVGTTDTQTYSIQTKPLYSVSGSPPSYLTNAFLFDNNGTTMRNSVEGQGNVTITSGASQTDALGIGGAFQVPDVVGSTFTNNMKGATSFTIATRLYFTSLASDPVFFGATSWTVYCQEWTDILYCGFSTGGDYNTGITILVDKRYSIVIAGNSTNICAYVVNMDDAPTTVVKDCKGSGGRVIGTGDNLFIGSPTTSSKMNGWYDEFEIYNKTFGEAEANEWLLNSGSVGAEQDMGDATPPTYSAISTNTTCAGKTIKFSSYWNDDVALHPDGTYIFSTNNTGTWTNESAVNFTATPSWANVTKILNSTNGIVVGYQWYVKDTALNPNGTGIQKITTRECYQSKNILEDLTTTNTIDKTSSYKKNILQSFTLENIIKKTFNFFRGIFDFITSIFSTSTQETSPSIGLDVIYPVGDLNVTKDAFFKISLNVTCLTGNCGTINVSLDPHQIEKQDNKIIEWKSNDFYYASENIDLNNYWINKYDDSRGVVSRISMDLNNSNNYLTNKKINITIAYPKGKDFLDLKVIPINKLDLEDKETKEKNNVISFIEVNKKNNNDKYAEITSKINALSLTSTNKQKIEIKNINNYELKTFEITFKDDKEYLIQAYISSEYGLNEKLYMYALGSFAGGSGTAGDPYQIETWEQLNETRNNLTASYILMNDLDSSSVGYTTYASSSAHSGAGWIPIGNETSVFNGILNGNNHKISDIYVYRPTTDYVGFIGILGASSVISNLGIINIDLTGDDSLGGLAGYNFGGSISNCYTTGEINGNYAGSFYVGGLVGFMNTGSILNSYSSCEVKGGLVCGGLVGSSFDAGDIINNSYSIGKVSGSNTLGGLVGSGSAVYNNNFWDNQTSEQSTSSVGTGKNTTQMKDFNTFNDASWNISTISSGEKNESAIWNIVDGLGYPLLSWSIDITKPNVVIELPISQNYTTGEIIFNITATDNTKIDTCLYSLDSGSTNNSMDNYGNYWVDINSPMDYGVYTANFYCNDTSNNWNNTEFVDFNVSIPDDQVKSGLVNTTEGATPFYTNATTNPLTTSSLTQGQSETINFWVNATGNSGTSHTFFAYANMTEGLSISNITDSWTVNIYLINHNKNIGQSIGISNYNSLMNFIKRISIGDFSLADILSKLSSLLRLNSEALNIDDNSYSSMDIIKHSLQEITFDNRISNLYNYIRSNIEGITINNENSQEYSLLRSLVNSLTLNGLTSRTSYLSLNSLQEFTFLTSNNLNLFMERLNMENFSINNIISIINGKMRLMIDSASIDNIINSILGIERTSNQELTIGQETTNRNILSKFISSSFVFGDSVGRISLLNIGEVQDISLLDLMIRTNGFSIINTDALTISEYIEKLLNLFRNPNQEITFDNRISNLYNYIRSNPNQEITFDNRISNLYNYIRSNIEGITITEYFLNLNGVAKFITQAIHIIDSGFAGIQRYFDEWHYFGEEDSPSSSSSSGGGGSSIINNIFKTEEQKSQFKIILISFSIFFLMIVFVILDLIRRRKRINKKFEFLFIFAILLILSGFVVATYILL